MRKRCAQLLSLAAIACVSLNLSPSPLRAGYDFINGFAPQDEGPVRGLATYGEYVYLAVDGPNVVGNRAVQEFTSGGTFLRRIGVGEAPSDVAVGPTGYIYLGDSFFRDVFEYDHSGSFIRAYHQQFPLLDPSVSVGVGGPGYAWTTSGNASVFRFDSTGALINQFQIPGLSNDAQPTGIAVDRTFGAAAFIAISDPAGTSGGNRVVTYLADGTLYNQFSSTGSGPGQLLLDYESSIAVDDLLRVYVADTYNHRVQIFDGASGQYLAGFGTFGTGDGQLSFPTTVAVDPTGTHVWVGDSSGNRVQHFMVPEPSTIALLAASSLALVGLRGRARRALIRRRPLTARTCWKRRGLTGARNGWAHFLAISLAFA